MTTTRLKYIQRVGAYRYFRPPEGKRVRLDGVEGSPEYLDHHRRLLATVESKPSPPRAQPEPHIGYLPGSIRWVIERFMGDRAFLRRKASTQRSYRYVLDIVTDRIGAVQIADLRRAHVRHLGARIAEEHGPSRADMVRKLLSKLWKFSLNIPAAGIKDSQPNPCRDVEAHYTAVPRPDWPEEVQRKFLDGASDELRLAFLLALYTGQRRGDLIKMRWADYDPQARTIEVIQEKTGERVPVAVHRTLAEALDAAEREHAHILTSHWRRPYSRDSLTRIFTKRLREIGRPEYTLHGLRKSAARKLAEAGCSVPEIMAITGHRKPDMALYYAREANKRTLTGNAIERWEEAERKAS